jgi:hypothetical protein
MSLPLIFEDNYKKLGLEVFSDKNLEIINGNKFRYDIKVFFIPAGYELSVDFNHFKTTKPSLFFITNQHLKVEKGEEEAMLLYYNRDLRQGSCL